MAENVIRSRGRPQNYKFDRGGIPTEMGPYIGIVVNNVDAVRSGRLQVWIAEFGATKADGTPDLSDPSLWRTVSYCPPFYGSTPQTGTSGGVGTYPGNRNSYGMWFTPPDLGTQVLCFFVGGDPSQGYYIGCVPDAGISHMVPAIGASNKYVAGNKSQENYFVNSPLLPVTEINELNQAINENPRFFDQPKPVQSVVAGVLFQQGLDRDPIRGPIRSSSQRESPSACYGISTPGKPIYQGGLSEKDIKSKLEKGEIAPQDVAVIGRRGGHTFVMDDGDLEGKDTLVRIRTAKGHQITMSDDGDCFFITHANGQTWIELGKQGTVDVFSTNSVNVRTQGSINLHADVDINMYAGNNIKIKSKKNLIAQADSALAITAETKLSIYSKAELGIRSDGNLGMLGKNSSWNGGTSLNFKAQQINLNGAATLPVGKVQSMKGYKLADTTFVANRGWIPERGKLETICTRAPTHEPYPYHNQGVNLKADLNARVLDSTSSADVTTTATVTGAQSATSLVSGTGVGNSLAQKTAAAVDSLRNVPVVNGITPEVYIKESPAVQSIGNLNISQLTSLTAQASVSEIFPSYDDEGNLLPGWQLNIDSLPVYAGSLIGERGVGVYGQSPETLTLTGYLKSAALNLITSPAAALTVLSAVNSWTGQYGVNNLNNYLDYPILQNLAQNEIMRGSYTGLIDAGALTGNESARFQAALIQPAAKFGVTTVLDWIEGRLDEAMTNRVKIVARQGQYAVDFIDTYGSVLDILPEIGGFTNTTERDDLDQAVSDIIGNDKIPNIEYADVVPETPVVPSLVTAGEFVLSNPATGTRSLVEQEIPPEAPEDGTFRLSPTKPRS